MLEVKNVSKDFSGIYALRNIDLLIYPGEVTAIIGENGAGKSTLMKVIAGVEALTDGRIEMAGREVQFRTKADAVKAGIGIVFQELNLFPT